MMKFFQRLGKALMLPVACLPVCGILMGIGYILAPAAMAGEVQGFTAGGLSYSIGLFLIKAGGALIDNMSWLFAIGVAVGMADDSDGTAGLAGLVSMYMITTLLSSGSVAGITGHEAAPAFGKIVNQFVGIVSGLIGANCYNKYKSVKLPDALAFFSGKRAVAIFTALYSIVAALVLFFVWPLVYGALVTLGETFIGMGALGAGIYAFFNRLLIPVGLAVGVIYYVVFRVVIVKFNLKTPGREDDDADETQVKLANNDFTQVAKIVLEGVGGPENVASIDNCITRLRLEIKDYTKVDEKRIKSAGVAGVMRPSKTSVQVIIGTQVQFVADEFKKLCK